MNPSRQGTKHIGGYFSPKYLGSYARSQQSKTRPTRSSWPKRSTGSFRVARCQ